MKTEISMVLGYYISLSVVLRNRKTNAKMLCLGNYFTPSKAIKELNFKLTATKESSEKAILWFQKNNYFN